MFHVLNLLGVIAHDSVVRLIGLQIFSRHCKEEIVTFPHSEQTPRGRHGRQSDPLSCKTVQLKDTHLRFL